MTELADFIRNLDPITPESASSERWELRDVDGIKVEAREVSSAIWALVEVLAEIRDELRFESERRRFQG